MTEYKNCINLLDSKHKKMLTKYHFVETDQDGRKKYFVQRGGCACGFETCFDETNFLCRRIYSTFDSDPHSPVCNGCGLRNCWDVTGNFCIRMTQYEPLDKEWLDTLQEADNIYLDLVASNL